MQLRDSQRAAEDDPTRLVVYPPMGHGARSEILRQVYAYLPRLCDCTMPKPSVVMPDWMMDEIDDRRHSRLDRSEWIRGAIRARLDAEDRGDWEECAPGDIHD